MTLLNRKVDYALLILCHLHRRPEGGCARAIADQFGLSRAFVANILKDLCQKDFVISQRGVKGGYTLRRPPTQVTMAELMDALADPFHLAECCGESPEDCALFGNCPIKGPIAEVHRRIRGMLSTVTLAELFGSGELPVELNVSRCRQLQAVE